MHEREEPTRKSFDEVREEIRDFLHERRKDGVFDSFLDGLKEKAVIEEVPDQD